MTSGPAAGTRRRVRLAAGAIGAWLVAVWVIGLVGASHAEAVATSTATTATTTYTVPPPDAASKDQPFTVPPGVYSVQIDAIGGQGGSSQTDPNTLTANPGGSGAEVTTTIAVTPGEVLYADVGSPGTAGVAASGPNPPVKGNTAQYGGAGRGDTDGGSGGGASDVRTRQAATANSAASRIVVAGGGGGSSLYALGAPAGPGGHGTSGATLAKGDDGAASQNSPGACEGGGGGGGNGTTTPSFTPGGAAGATAASCPLTDPTYASTAGAPGIGGDGGHTGGGGGGGGYIGGGGGGANHGGGGGGSSFVDPSQVIGATTMATSGHAPQIVFTYAAPTASPDKPNLIFGTQPLYTTSGWVTLTLANNGAAPLQVTRAVPVGTAAGDYAVDDTGCAQPVAVGASCAIRVAFTPQATSAAANDRTATLNIASNATPPGTYTTVSLSGTGGQLPTGPTGATGVTGGAGPTGPSGLSGATGPSGSTGPSGNAGAVGPTGPLGPAGSRGANGTNGLPGPAGANGANGAPGAAGATGPVGATGPQGPAGKVELVTCKTVTTKARGKKKATSKQVCTARLVTGPVRFTARSADATLSRAGRVYATGSARATAGHRLVLSLVERRSLLAGVYTLALRTGHGRHAAVRRMALRL